MVKNNVKSLPKKNKKFGQKPCKILTKKKMDDDEKKETLKTLIRYIIGDSLKKKNFFLGQKQRKILTKKKQKFGQKPCKILTKKKVDEEKEKETLKTLIRYIIGDVFE